MQSISFPCPVPLCEIRHANVSSYLHEYCSGRKVAIITDESVAKLYRHLMPDGLIISIPAGESSKSLSMVESIIGKLIDGGCGRDVLLIGFGGGVVTDICGLVASIYLRGVDFGLVPTTLLAQIDAAIGGKTGVNHGSLKNMIGTFRLPGFVICDPLFLETLTQADYLSGLAELVKTALVHNPLLFELIRVNIPAIQNREAVLLKQLVSLAVQSKIEIVENDPTERHLRRILNFGHSFGHCYEMLLNLPHGLAVAEGMYIASRISNALHLLSDKEYDAITSTLAALGFERIPKIDPKSLESILRHDKKGSGESIRYVLLKAIGQAEIQEISLVKLMEYYHDLR